MIDHNYLDTLYRWKVEADQKVEQLDAKFSEPSSITEADLIQKLHKQKLASAKELAEAHKATIRVYLDLHSKP